MSDIVVGIDLGTTNSLVAYIKNDRPEIIEDTDGKRFIKSSVYISNIDSNKWIIGKDKLDFMDPSYHIHNVKRLIGKTYKEVKSSKITFLYDIEDRNNKPLIVANLKEGRIEQTPEEINAKILNNLMTNVKSRLEGKFTNRVIITVPAYFQQTQREATRKAAELAKLEVVQFINEPTAAALYHVYNNECNEKKHILVFDFGGGTLDLSVVETKNKNVNVLSIGGDDTIGGIDFDQCIFNYVANMLLKEQNFDISIQKKRLQFRLLEKCIAAKHFFSKKDNDKTEITLYDLGCKQDLEDFELTEKVFNEITKKLCDTIEAIIKQFLDEKVLKSIDIDELILVGGSSRLQCIRNILGKFFKTEKMKHTVNPDEAVALGAAIYANQKNLKETDRTYTINEILSFSLGTEVKDGRMSFIIKKHSTIPTTKTKEYATCRDNQTSVAIKVFEGENIQTANNSYLGELIIDGLKEMPAGKVIVTVTFHVDLDGILKVSAYDNILKNKKDITLQLNAN